MERVNQAVVLERNVLEPVQQFVVDPGYTIKEILELATIPEPVWNNVVVTMNGVEVARDQWDRVEPREEDVLGIHVIPLGGDGKSLLRSVLMIAVAVVATIYGGPLGAAIGLKGTAATAVGAAVITLAGTLVVNALVPPPKPATPSLSAAGDAYFLNSQSNRARLYETVPIVYGLHKIYGNLATAPNIFSAGTSSIFTALYDWGLGKLDVWDIRAGDTKLSRFPATVRTLKGVPNYFDPQQPELGLAPVDLEIVEYPTKSQELNIALNEDGDQGRPSTAPFSKSAVVELAFPQGLVRYDEKGNEQTLSVNFTGEYRGPDTNGVWARWPSGSRGYAGDHFRVSGGVLTGRDQNNPNPPAAVDIELDRYELEKGTKVLVRLIFKQETFYIRPQTDLWFMDAEKDQVERGFDFEENPDPSQYPPEWLLVTGDQPAKGVFVIREGFEYGFEFNVPNKTGWFLCQTNLQNFKDAPPPDGYSFPAAVESSRQCYVGNPSVDGGDPDQPPISRVLYNRDPGQETYLSILESRSWANGELGDWQQWETGVMLYYLGENYPVELQLVEQYKGTLMETVVHDSYQNYSVQLRTKYYSLRQSPKAAAGSSRLIGPGFFFEPNIPDQSSASFNVSGRELTPGRVSIVIPFKKEGQYDIRVVRRGDHENNQGDDRYVEKCSWTRLTSRGYPVTEAGERRGILNLQKKHTLSEVRFQSSENIQGSVQQISATARSYLRWHDGTQWREPRVDGEVSRNPAWAVLDILTGYSIQNSTDIPVEGDWDFDGGWIKDEQIDFRSFVKLAAHCNEIVRYIDRNGVEQSRSRYRFDMVLGTDQPIIETVNAILSMCRCQLIINQQGQVSVMLDSDRDWDGNLRVPRQVFTPANSWNFSAERSFVDLPHAFNVSFIDPSLGYLTSNYRVFRPGYNERNSTIFEDISTFGVTHWHQAAQWGLYQMAQGVLRSERFSCTVDCESLVVQRGDLVEISQDSALLGGRPAIVNTVTGDTLEVSETYGSIKNPGYTLRTNAGDIFTGSCVVNGDKVILDVQRPAIAGDLIVIGEQNDDGRVTETYIVQSVTPKADFTADLSMVLFDPELYTVDDGGWPSYDPNFSETDLEGGYHKTIELDGKVYLEIIDRYAYSVADLKWDVTPDDDQVHRYVIEYMSSGSTEKQFVGSVPASEKYFQHRYRTSNKNFGAGIYTVTPMSTLGYYGVGSEIYLSAVYDRSIPAPPVPFYCERLVSSDAMRFVWTPVKSDIDLEGYVIYRMPAGTTRFDWSLAEKYAEGNWNEWHTWTDILVPGHFWICAVDTSGNRSEPVPEGVLWTLIQVICGDPLWLGNKQHCHIEDRELVLDADVPLIEYNGRSGRYAFYEHDEHTDLEQTANLAIRSFIETETNLDEIVIADPPWDPMADIDPMSWQPDGLHYEVYHEASVDGGPWERFHAEWVRGRNVHYRLVIASYKPNQIIRVQRACIKIHTTNNIVVKD